MGILGRKASASSSDKSMHGGHVPNVKLTSEDQRNLKFRSENVHDPILDAVNEQQPFEQQQNVNHQRMSSLNHLNGMKDIFGAPIQNADISNPTRARDERPMDTIRSFEYAITGDPIYRDQLETPQLGWRLRSSFNYGATTGSYTTNPATGYSDGNYGYHDNVSQAPAQAIYTAPQAAPVETKKKRGLFGRKK